MSTFIGEHLTQLVEFEGIVLVAGIAWNIYRETQKGITIRKLISDIEESANSPLVDMLKNAFKS